MRLPSGYGSIIKKEGKDEDPLPSASPSDGPMKGTSCINILDILQPGRKPFPASIVTTKIHITLIPGPLPFLASIKSGPIGVISAMTKKSRTDMHRLINGASQSMIKYLLISELTTCRKS